MQITIVTLFPPMFVGPFSYSMVKKAQEKNILTLNFIDIRHFATDAYGTVDDKPYGGGAGMILKVDVLDAALNAAKDKYKDAKNTYTILTDPKGETYSQKLAKSYASIDHLIIVCGHYEGIDARVDELVDAKISIGNYILTGGEIPAMVIVDSVARLLPGVLRMGAADSESFSDDTLEYPQYTRPQKYKNMQVPDVLVSGNHEHVDTWRKKHSKKVK